MTFCHELATMLVFLDGPEIPPTPMCTRHGAMYVDDAEYQSSPLDRMDADVKCQFVVSGD